MLPLRARAHARRSLQSIEALSRSPDSGIPVALQQATCCALACWFKQILLKYDGNLVKAI